MNVGEPPGRDRNLRKSRTNLLMNLTSLALDAGSGPGGDILRETSLYEGPGDQPMGRTNAMVREFVKIIKNPLVELNWNQRTWRPCERSQRTEEAWEGTETTRRQGLERRDDCSAQEGCMVEMGARAVNKVACELGEEG